MLSSFPCKFLETCRIYLCERPDADGRNIVGRTQGKKIKNAQWASVLKKNKLCFFHNNCIFLCNVKSPWMHSGKIHAIEFGKSKVYGRQFNRFSIFSRAVVWTSLMGTCIQPANIDRWQRSNQHSINLIYMFGLSTILAVANTTD